MLPRAAGYVRRGRRERLGAPVRLPSIDCRVAGALLCAADAACERSVNGFWEGPVNRQTKTKVSLAAPI